jgi:hypothetical protein
MLHLCGCWLCHPFSGAGKKQSFASAFGLLQHQQSGALLERVILYIVEMQRSERRRQQRSCCCAEHFLPRSLSLAAFTTASDLVYLPLID